MATSAHLYPYDPTGQASSNLVVAENHTVQPPNNISDASFVIPRAAPFFGDSVIVRTGPTEASQRLEEGVDYYLTHSFVTLSYALSRPVYGSITLINRAYSGEIYITYQTVGGDYVLDSYSIIEERTRSLYNVYMVTWEQVSGSYPQLPPYDHKMAGDDLVGFGALVDAVQLLSAAIATGGIGGGGTGGDGTGSGGTGSEFAALMAHMNANTAHTKAQVGLSNVDNYKTANEADVAAASTRTFMTPAMTKYYLENTVFVSQLNVARQDISALKDRVTLVENKNVTQDNTLNELTTSVAQVANTVDNLTESLENLTEDVTAALLPFEGLPARTEQLETKMTDALNRIGNLERGLETTNDAVDALDTRLAALENVPPPSVAISEKVRPEYVISPKAVVQPKLFKIPVGRTALVTMIAQVSPSNKQYPALEGHLFNATDEFGIVQEPVLNGVMNNKLVTVKSMTYDHVAGVLIPLGCAGATDSFMYYRGNDTYEPVEYSVNDGPWTDTLDPSLVYRSAFPTGFSVGVRYDIQTDGYVRVKVRQLTNEPCFGFYHNPFDTDRLSHLDQENKAWVIKDFEGNVLDAHDEANHVPIGDYTFPISNDNDAWAVPFKHVEFCLYREPIPIGCAGATDLFECTTALDDFQELEFSVNGGPWSDTLDENVATIQRLSNGYGALLRLEAVAEGFTQISFRQVNDVPWMGFILDTDTYDSDRHQENSSWVIKDFEGNVIDAYDSNNYIPGDNYVYDKTSNENDVAIPFRAVEVCLFKPLSTTIPPSFNAVAGTVETDPLPSTVLVTDKTVTTPIDLPEEVWEGDILPKIDDVIVNGRAFPVSETTVYEGSNSRGAPSTGMCQVSIANDKPHDLYVGVMGYLSFVSIADNTEPTENPITVIFPE